MVTELFGWPFDCVQAWFHVIIQFKSSCSTACTKNST